MKVSFVLLLIVAVASVSIEASIEDDKYNQTARLLFEKTEFLLAFIQHIRGDLQKASVKAKEGGAKIELRISNDAKIEEIEQKLDSYASNKNADECKNLYALKRKDLNQKLQNILEDEVVKQAESIIQSTELVEKELTTISDNLQGVKLEEEINACRKLNNNACKLYDGYSGYGRTINRNDDVIRNFERHSLLIVDFILATKIDVQLQNQIDTNVYFPVNDCLNKL